MRKLAAVLTLLAAARVASADNVAPPRYEPELDDAFAHLYSSDFNGAQSILDKYVNQHPSDPVGYAVKASGYVFSELHRLGILESDFFEDDKRITDKKKNLQPDPKVRDAFYAAVHKSQDLANAQLAKDSKNTNALFALCMDNGDMTDYMALIEKHQFQSLAFNKDAYRDGKRLLAIAPDYYDAYLTSGFTEYIIGSVPVIFRWMVRFDDVKGDKKAGVKNLELVAQKGHYLKPFAKLLLATAYLRDKRISEARALLAELSQSYPQNALLKREYDRLSTRM